MRAARGALAALAAGWLLGCQGEPPTGTGNQAPVIGVLAAAPAEGLRPGQPLTVTVGATDPDGDPVGYDWAVSGGALLASTGPQVTWNPPATAGRHTLRVVASDGKGGAAAGYLSLEVAGSAVTLGAPLILRPAPAIASPSPSASPSASTAPSPSPGAGG